MKTPIFVVGFLVAITGLGVVVYRGSNRADPASPISTNTAPDTASGTASGSDEPAGHLTIPDVALVNQRGESIHLYSDLIRDKVVAISFIYTTCTTICPPIGASFARLQEALGPRAGRDVNLISITLDPVGDTPARLNEWGQRFGAGPGWTLAGGDPGEITRLLKVLGVYTAAKEQHAPILLIGDDSRGEWVRVHGVASPARLVGGVERLLAQHPAASADPGAHRYFGDTPLIDQDGTPVRFYSDLIRGKVVVISAFFASCDGSCPIVARTLERLQDQLGDRLGRDVSIVSISVDAEHDTPAKLKAFGERFHARPGWRFLTGEPPDVSEVLKKLGQYVDAPTDHSALILAGNDRTGLWKKVFGLAKPDEVLATIQTVIQDDDGRDASRPPVQ